MQNDYDTKPDDGYYVTSENQRTNIKHGATAADTRKRAGFNIDDSRP